MIKYFILIFFVLKSSLFALEIDSQTSYIELLSHSEIYIDNNKSENINTLQDKKFKPNSLERLGFGYSPNFTVWIKFTLTNNSAQTIEKIVEYNNPLSSYVNFYEGKVLKKQDGLLAVDKKRKSLNPILKVNLKAYESKTFFIETSSIITTLIVKLNLWNSDDLWDKEIKNGLILALFFGAMGIIIVYNFIIYMATKELSYFYYVLFFLSISFHHFLYKGVGTLYFSSEVMQLLINNASFIVAMPMVFLALFVQHVLNLKQYPKLNKTLNYLFVIYFVAILLVMISNQYQYRSLFLVFMLLTLFYMAIYAVVKKNKQAYLIIGGLTFLTTSGLFMYLSSKGIYDVFKDYPYYTEFSLVAEITIFSLALASNIKMLNQEKVKAKERKLLLKDLNHRIQNNMQTISSFLILQRDEIEDNKTKEILTSLEHRMLATSELYLLLEIKDEMSLVDMNRYLSSIIKNIETSFKREGIKVKLVSEVNMNSEDVIYCGLIVNEAVTNAFKHAFNHSENGEIKIELYDTETKYYLGIEDNGAGFSEQSKDSLGMSIIDTLATIQLEGTLNIEKSNGTKIEINWDKHER